MKLAAIIFVTAIGVFLTGFVTGYLWSIADGIERRVGRGVK